MIHNGLLCSGSSSCTPYNWRPTQAKNELVTINFTPLSNRLTTPDIYFDNFFNLFQLKDPLTHSAATQFVFCFHGEKHYCKSFPSVMNIILRGGKRTALLLKRYCSSPTVFVMEKYNKPHNDIATFLKCTYLKKCFVRQNSMWTVIMATQMSTEI